MAIAHSKSYYQETILRETLGTETLLAELLQAMSEQERLENFEFIARMHDIDLGNDDE